MLFFSSRDREGEKGHGAVIYVSCQPPCKWFKTCIEMKRQILYMAKEEACCWHGEREAILSSLFIRESSVTCESMKDLIVSQMPPWILVCTLKTEAQKVEEVLEMKHKMALSHGSLSSFIVPSSFKVTGTGSDLNCFMTTMTLMINQLFGLSSVP